MLRKGVLGNVPTHGVCIYLRSGLIYAEVSVQLPNVVAAHLLHHNVYITTIYHSPSISCADDDQLINFPCNFCLGKNVILLGDFNLLSIHFDRDYPCYRLTFTEHQFYDCFATLGLTQ